ncbi:hypothetical protein R3P38DRAFT_3102997 [Favolaschia claudopus]|uniref:Uncharacterized protein n=1 Tax=Favolaschia claudopus TaxID=2862362 RepID=A0AAV9ZKU2_9AGAR
MDSDDSEYESLGSTLSGSLVTTVNVSGGRGGPGGRAGQRGGTGGNGEGPRVYLSSKSTVVNVRGSQYGLPVNDSSDWESLLDSNFRRIPLGDLFLQRQLYVNGPDDRVDFGRKRCSVRIVRSAEIRSRKFTVATYQGDNAETEWKENVERYMNIRHKNILQLYGTVRSRNIWAAVFHGDFIPIKDFLKSHEHSSILTCYIHAYTAHDHKSLAKYLCSTFDRNVWDYALLVNRSNGRICVDLEGLCDVDSYFGMLGEVKPAFDELPNGPLSPMQVLSSADVSYIAQTLPLRQYHSNIACHMMDKVEWYRVIPSTATVHLGGVYCAAGNGNSLQVVALLRQYPLQSHCWRGEFRHGLEPSSTYVGSGWRRFSFSEAIHAEFLFTYDVYSTEMTWISQANYIFGRLHVKSDFHKYGFVDDICFEARLSRSRKPYHTPSEGYLFMCPPQDFLIEPGSVQWPDRPWYWSLDPSGVEGLSDEEATEIGFPTIEPLTRLGVISAANDSVYAGLRVFHEGKGFDPESQDVAVELGDSLFELLSDDSEEPLQVIEQKYYDSESGWKDIIAGIDGNDVINLLEEIDTNITPHTEFTSFNETGEFTGQTSASASFIPRLDSLVWPTSYPSDDAGLEEFFNLVMLPSQSDSAVWDDQNWNLDSFDAQLPQIQTWNNNGPFPTFNFDFIGDPGYEGPSDSRKRRAEDDLEYEPASRAKRTRLVEY